MGGTVVVPEVRLQTRPHTSVCKSTVALHKTTWGLPTVVCKPAAAYLFRRRMVEPHPVGWGLPMSPIAGLDVTAVGMPLEVAFSFSGVARKRVAARLC